MGREAYRERLLHRLEEDEARLVFAETLPYGRIYLSNRVGLRKRPFTIPHPKRRSAFLINIGVAAFPDTLSNSSLLIHELTHVWQGTHRRTPFSYLLDSVFNQVLRGDQCYEYELGKRWSQYSAEQQAMLVQDWFEDGMSTLPSDERFPYIRDHIRTGTV